jgi:hypothetical protein
MNPIAAMRGETNNYLYVEADPGAEFRAMYIGTPVVGNLIVLKNPTFDHFSRVLEGDETAFEQLYVNDGSGAVFNAEEVILRCGNSLKRIGNQKITEMGLCLTLN